MLSSVDAINLERFSISLFRSVDINLALLTGFSSSLALSLWLDDLEDPFLYSYKPSLFTLSTALVSRSPEINTAKTCSTAVTLFDH